MQESSAGAAGPSPRGRSRSAQRGAEPHQDGLSLRAAQWMLCRRAGVIGLCAIGIPVLAAVALHNTPARYTATGTLLYAPNEYKPRELQSILRVDPTTEAVMASQAELVRGLDLVERAATQLDLFASPTFNAALRPAGRLALWMRSARRWCGLPVEPPLDPKAEPARNAVLLSVQQALAVQPLPGSRVLDVSFTADDPTTAAAVVNRLMDLYIRDQLAAKFRAVHRAQDWLESRAAELRAEVRHQEDRVAAYRVQQGMVRGMHAGLDAEQISTLTDALSRARSELAQAEGRMDATRDGAGGAAQAAVSPSVVEAQQQADLLAAQVRSLLERLGPNHPDVRGLQRQLELARQSVSAARARVMSATAAEMRAARARVAALEQDMAAAQAQSETQSQAQTPLHEMERDLDASRTLLQSVLDRLQETRQQAAVESADAREVSLALPPTEPSFPRTRTTLAAAIGFGVLFGLLAAYLTELADTTLKSGEDVRDWLGLRCLALVPRVGRRALRGALVCEHGAYKPISPFAEQMRALRAGLWFGRERPRTVAIAAARPAEGKTTVTLALGRSAALSGERVVAIDCDMRRPSFARLMGGEAEPGLADLLRGAARLEDVLRRDHLSDLVFIPAGRGGAETLGLLMSEAMGRLLAGLREEYDLILMDAPPANAMTDTRIIAQIADATVVCARWRATPRAVVQNTVELLEAAGASVAGIALTCVDARAHARSGSADAETCHPRYRAYWRS